MQGTLLRFRRSALFLMGLLPFLLLVWRSDVAMDGARRGLALCTNTLLPSLFPFLVFSEIVVASGAGEALGSIAGAPIRALFGLSPSGATSFLLGAVCGFPVGTATAVSYCEGGKLSQKELQRLLLFCNNPSSGFLVAAVGVGLFGSKRVGLALFCITLLSAATLGVLLRFLFGKATTKAKTTANGAKNALSVTTITESVRRALFSFLQVGALVVFFSSVAACLSDLVRAPLFQVLLHGTLELTGGVAAATARLPVGIAFRVTAFFASFSGLSVCAQILSLAASHGMRARNYLLAKLAQGGIALLFAELYLRLAHPDLTPTTSVSVLAWQQSTPLLLSLSFVALLCAMLAFWRKKRAHQRVHP